MAWLLPITGGRSPQESRVPVQLTLGEPRRGDVFGPPIYMIFTLRAIRGATIGLLGRGIRAGLNYM